MSSPAQTPGDPVRIEVPTPRVDATVDLRAVLESIAQNAEHAATRSAPRAGDANERLKTVSQLARELAQHLSKLSDVHLGIDADLDEASRERPPDAKG